jgi:hypothetical protein
LRTLILQTATGPEQVPASVVRTALGLRSTWMTIGVLRLDRPTGGAAVVYGSSATLAGVGRGLGTPRLASSPDGMSWAPVTSVTPDATGAVSVGVKPLRTTRYRLEAPAGASPALLLPVAPRVTLTRPTALEPDVFTGAVRPKLPGSVVTIERRRGLTWALVDEVVVDPSGAFSAELDAVPAGTYRARTSATADFAGGTSPIVQVAG